MSTFFYVKIIRLFLLCPRMHCIFAKWRYGMHVLTCSNKANERLSCFLDYETYALEKNARFDVLYDADEVVYDQLERDFAPEFFVLNKSRDVVYHGTMKGLELYDLVCQMSLPGYAYPELCLSRYTDTKKNII